jgi:predicted small lipoprotein YifL
MRTNRLHNLHQKLDQKLQLKSILLTFITVTFLSACGIKGNLYQTPEQAVPPKDEVVVQDDESQVKNVNEEVGSQPVTTLDESQKKQAVQQSVEQTQQATSQSTDQVKEQQ